MRVVAAGLLPATPLGIAGMCIGMAEHSVVAFTAGAIGAGFGWLSLCLRWRDRP